MSVGIYKLISNKSDKVYIGSSVNIEKRFAQHLDMLKNNQHHSKKLQKHFNLESPEITVEIVELCKEGNLSELESKYIKQFDSFKNGFNASTDTRRKSKSKNSPNFKKLLAEVLLWKENPEFLERQMQFCVKALKFDKIKKTDNYARAFKSLRYTRQLSNFEQPTICVEFFYYNKPSSSKEIFGLKHVEDFTSMLSSATLVECCTHRQFLERVIRELCQSNGTELLEYV